MDCAKVDPQASESASPLELQERLDLLWAAYLDQLHAYTAAQETLQRHMASGFLALARANFEPQAGVRRYGSDFYHNRAVATRRARIDQDDRGRVRLSVGTDCASEPSARDEEKDGTSEKICEQQIKSTLKAEPEQQPSPPTTPNEECFPPFKKLPLQSDPIRWFGFFASGHLRSAQSSFNLALDEALAASVEATSRMRNLERDIRRCRRGI